MQPLKEFKNELSAELEAILKFWMDHTVDQINGGFVGKINNDNLVDSEARKGSVLNARILWSFSAAYNLTGQEAYLEHAHRAYEYIIKHFIDKDFGGVYWTVDFKGEPLDTKKQVYSISFTIYALSEFYKATQKQQSKDLAINLYQVLVDKSFDPQNTGYFEAFTREWLEIEDLRLSTKDANEKKTMNTHLHVLEAFTNLFRIWPDESLKKHIQLLINNFLDHIIDKKSFHLILFFDENWNQKSDIISYGHDIEAAWLLLEAAEVIDDFDLISKTEAMAVKMAGASTEGLDSDGALLYELEPSHNTLIKEKHWWVQDEAIVGFFNAWQLTGDKKFLDHSLNAWQYVKNNILDKEHGEWLWGIAEDGKIMDAEDKAGLWKCPYHNSRACIEIIKRTANITAI